MPIRVKELGLVPKIFEKCCFFPRGFEKLGYGCVSNCFHFSFILGLVFYQHKNLHLEKHGYYNVVKRGREKNERDYELWKEGKWLPTPR